VKRDTLVALAMLTGTVSSLGAVVGATVLAPRRGDEPESGRPRSVSWADAPVLTQAAFADPQAPCALSAYPDFLRDNRAIRRASKPPKKRR